MSAPRPGWRPRPGIDGELIELPASQLDRGAARPGRQRSTAIRTPTASWSNCRCRDADRREAVLHAIAPGKGRRRLPSAECRPAVSAGRELPGDLLVPCTPYGCLHLLRETLGDDGLAGREAVIVGRSNIVGKPMAALLLARRLHRHRRAFPHAATCPRSAAGPTSWSPPSAGRK